MTPWCKSLRCCKWPQLAPSVDQRHQKRGVESPPRARAYRPAARRRELPGATRTESGPDLETPEARPQERVSEMSIRWAMPPPHESPDEIRSENNWCQFCFSLKTELTP